jgi:protein SCO1/2
MALVVALALGGCAGSSTGDGRGGGGLVVTSQGDDGWHGALLDAPYPKPDLSFTDVDGGTFDLATDTTKPVTLVFFGYTNCPDVCSAVLADAASALRRAPADVRSKTQLVFITTDPARDTPHVIRAFLNRFDPSFVGLTGPMMRIEQAAEQLGVALTGTQKLPSGGYDVGHGAQLIGWGPGGRTTVVWTPGTSVGALREDVTRLSGEA